MNFNFKSISTVSIVLLFAAACGQRGVNSGGYCDSGLRAEYNKVIRFGNAMSAYTTPTELRKYRDMAAALKEKYPNTVCGATREGKDIELNVEKEMGQIIALVEASLGEF